MQLAVGKFVTSRREEHTSVQEHDKY